MLERSVIGKVNSIMQYNTSAKVSGRQKISVPGTNWVNFSLPRLKSSRPLMVSIVSSIPIVGGVLSATDAERFIRDENDEFRPLENPGRFWVEDQQIIEIPILRRDLIQLGEGARIVIWNAYSESPAEALLWLATLDPAGV